MRKIRVAVLMGGRSPEYEISLISGQEVVKNLPSKFVPIPLVISRDGRRWLSLPVKNLLSLPDPISFAGTKKEIVNKSKVNRVVTSEKISKDIDVAFIAMHGPYGEDGTIQGMLELAGIKYTGSGVLASALGMDKVMFRKLMEREKIPVPKWVEVKKGGRIPNLRKLLGAPPYFIKPSAQGSSVGASLARTDEEVKKGLRFAFEYGDSALIDEYLDGKEITCSILGNDKPHALPLVEIVPLKGEFFNYQSKYTESGAKEIVPARLSKKQTRKVQNLAIAVYQAVGARGFARVDFILKDNRSPFVLEINTIPGLTPVSLFPKAAKAAGIRYGRLIEKIINYGLSD